MTDTILTAFDAQSMQDLDADLSWIVTDRDPAHPDTFVARPHTATTTGGVALPLILMARTLADLHFLLPKGLRRLPNAMLDLTEVLEMWGSH